MTFGDYVIEDYPDEPGYKRGRWNVADRYPMDKFSPGDGDMGVHEGCAHEGVECEFNVDEEGNPECHCRCDDCQLPYASTEEERAQDEADNELDKLGIDRNEAPW